MKAKAKLSCIISIQLILVFLFSGCSKSNQEPKGEGMRIIFLHHSTGEVIWKGGVPQWFKKYNKEKRTNYRIEEQVFPQTSPYGWKNYPFDYYNIWVKNAGEKPFMSEPTLEILTKRYDVIIWKHCFPTSKLMEDTGNPDINSEEKRMENYKLQYEALKKKMRQFPENRFILWTGAALVKNSTDEQTAKRAQEFFHWVKNQWDEKGDNIYIWDFHQLETEEGLYLKEEYAFSPNNSHPNEKFSQRVAPLFCQRIVDVIEDRGDSSSLTGE